MIRDAAPSERAALEALQRRASDVWEEYRADLAAHPDAIALAPELVAAGRVRVAVSEDGGVVGFSVVLPARDGACELDGLFVEPAAMRDGVGRALVADAADRAHAEGATRMSVIANPRAVAFYERVGFVAGDAAQTRFGPARWMHLSVCGRFGTRAEARFPKGGSMTVAEVDAVAQAFHDGVANRDAAALASLYHEDARFLAPGFEPAEGPAAIRATMQALLDMGARALDIEALDVREAGDMTIEYGRYTLVVEPEGVPEMTDVGKYVVVYETRDGDTKIILDCFNSNAPPPA